MMYINKVKKLDLDRGIEYLKSIGCREIILFGSMSDGSFNKNSDIDIAISGISPVEYFKAVASISSIIGHDVDLVFLGHIPKPIEDRIRSSGKQLYAA